MVCFGLFVEVHCHALEVIVLFISVKNVSKSFLEEPEVTEDDPAKLQMSLSSQYSTSLPQGETIYFSLPYLCISCIQVSIQVLYLKILFFLR